MSRAFRMLCRPVLLAVLISFPWLHSFVGESWTPQLAGRGVGRVERGDGSGNRDWSLFISAEEAATGLTEQTMAAAATLLNSTGFVVLQGASLFSELELQLGQETADVQLAKVTSAAERLDLLGRSPWVRGHNPRKLFEFQEALSYSQGRLDMPQLMGVPELRGSRWCDHSGLRGIAESAFGRRCEQSVLGALWNFPGSGPPVWHRDGFDNPLLVAVTAACDYPQTVGFIHGQPMSHNRARFSASEGMKAPITSKGEVGVPLPLRRGETLLFFYTTKHAATPNLSNLDRCLLYSVHGPVGVRDEHNHKDFLPSLFELSKEEAKDLDAFYRHHLGI